MSKKQAKKAKQKLEKQVQKRGEELTIPDEITSDEQYRELSNKVVKIKKMKKYAESEKTHYSQPFLDTYRNVRDFFKPTIEKLDNWESDLKDVLSDYTKKKNDEIEKENQEKIEQAKEESDKTVVEVEQKEKIKEVQSEDGKVQAREKLDYEIEDIDKLPDQYVKKKAKKREIRKALKEGIEIPGVKVEKTYNMAVYTND